MLIAPDPIFKSLPIESGKQMISDSNFSSAAQLLRDFSNQLLPPLRV